jgi:hypothetical protein
MSKPTVRAVAFDAASADRPVTPHGRAEVAQFGAGRVTRLTLQPRMAMVG